jgi:hypothetical protein
MKTWVRNLSIAALALVAGALIIAGGQTVAQNVACYMPQGGASIVVGSGCTLEIASGGTTTHLGSSAVVTRGTVAATAAVTYISTGLTTIASCNSTIQRSSAPGLSTTTVTWTGATGQLALYQWKPTSVSNPTLIASTDAVTLSWACVGA